MSPSRIGDLAALDAYDVPLEQSTGVGWANRAAEALYARPDYDPTVVARTASPLVTITEGDIGRATEAAMGVSGGGMSTRDPLRMYHATTGNLAKFGPAPEYRGATYLAQTPEGAMKGAVGGRQDFYAIPGEQPTWRTHKVDVPNEGISGLHWTPIEQQWHGALPERLVGDEALEAALKGQPNYGQIPWDDLYEHRKVGDRLYEYLKKPPKEYTLEEAAKTNRDVYGSQIPGYNSGNDREIAKRLRELGMKGFIISDEGGVSLAHIDPELLKIVPPGIRAYHSSPHDFDRFDLSKIGTGEGAQMYGHGLYFAENPAVSGQGGQYWDAFKRRFEGPEREAADLLQRSRFDREQAISEAKARVENLMDVKKSSGSGFSDPAKKDYFETLLKERQQELELLRSGQPVGPRTYEVNINADPAHFLDWDKPLRQQDELVRSALQKYGVDPESASLGQAFNKIGDYPRAPNRDALVTQRLGGEGVPGIKYLDEGSRGVPTVNGRVQATGQGKYNIVDDFGVQAGPFSTLEEAQQFLGTPKQTSNYVVFDPGIIDIRKKYGIAGVPAGMGALAAQDNYSTEELR